MGYEVPLLHQRKAGGNKVQTSCAVVSAGSDVGREGHNASHIPAASQGAGGCLSPLHPRRRPLRSFYPTSATAAGAGRNYLIGRILG